MVFTLRSIHIENKAKHAVTVSVALLWTHRWIPVFRRNILPPSSALKMETLCPSETPVPTYGSRRRCRLEEQRRNVHRSASVQPLSIAKYEMFSETVRDSVHAFGYAQKWSVNSVL
jgi:hypothetical protein